MDLLPLIIFALPIGVFLSSVMFTNYSSTQIAQEHREHVNAVRERVLRERMQQQRVRAQPSGPVGMDSAAPSSTSSSSSSASTAPPRPSAAAAPTASPAPRVPSRDCPICLEDARFAVESNCNHIFCAECFLTYFERGGSSMLPQAVICPCCRRRVDTLITRFKVEEESSNEMPSKLSSIQAYNARFSSQPRSFRESWNDTPTYLRRFATELTTSPWATVSLLWRTHFLLSFLGSILYVLSPFDLLPELVFGVLGLVDDVLILVGASVLLASVYRAATVRRQAQRV